MVFFCLAACGDKAPPPSGDTPDAFGVVRARMVEEIRDAGGVVDPRVLDAMRAVPRHEFVPEAQRPAAYENRALPIGEGQEISPPFIVAIMAELAEIDADDTVLEIGTGSGYGAAVLARLARVVHTIEIVPALGEAARARLARLGVDNVAVHVGDGYAGWPEAAPYDAIVVTAAPPEVPAPLKEQLKVGGRLVIPVGERHQRLMVLTRTAAGFERSRILGVEFSPMKGAAQK
jgi:protein-L-isoaspartate(D-aspartate) O-methyltransferase